MADSKFKRTDFYKAVAVAAVTFLGFGAISAAGASAQAAEETPAGAVPVEGEYISGTYSASARGLSSNVKVEMTFSDTALTDVKIDVSGETPVVGGAIGGEMESRLLDAQSAEIDGVTGATATSNAIITAAGECISMAEGK